MESECDTICDGRMLKADRGRFSDMHAYCKGFDYGNRMTFVKCDQTIRLTCPKKEVITAHRSDYLNGLEVVY